MTTSPTSSSFVFSSSPSPTSSSKSSSSSSSSSKSVSCSSSSSKSGSCSSSFSSSSSSVFNLSQTVLYNAISSSSSSSSLKLKAYKPLKHPSLSQTSSASQGINNNYFTNAEVSVSSLSSSSTSSSKSVSNLSSSSVSNFSSTELYNAASSAASSSSSKLKDAPLYNPPNPSSSPQEAQETLAINFLRNCKYRFNNAQEEDEFESKLAEKESKLADDPTFEGRKKGNFVCVNQSDGNWTAFKSGGDGIRTLTLTNSVVNSFFRTIEIWGNKDGTIEIIGSPTTASRETFVEELKKQKFQFTESDESTSSLTVKTVEDIKRLYSILVKGNTLPVIKYDALPEEENDLIKALVEAGSWKEVTPLTKTEKEILSLSL